MNTLSVTKHNFQALKGATIIPFSDSLLANLNRHTFHKVFLVRSLQHESEKRQQQTELWNFTVSRQKNQHMQVD